MTLHQNNFKIAESLLLTPYGLSTQNLERVFSEIFAHRADDADLYFQYTRSEGWSLEEGIVKGGSFSIDQGVGVRTVVGDKTAFAYSDNIHLDALLDAARVTRDIAPAVNARGIKVPSQSIQPVPMQSISPYAANLYAAHDPIASLTSAEKVSLLERLEKKARALDSRVTQVMASVSAEYDVVLIARADGCLAADVRPLVRVNCSVVVESNGRREQGFAGGGGRSDYGYFTDEMLESYAKEAVRQALVNLEAIAAPAGVLPVVLGAGWPGVLLHEAIGHGLEGDFNRKGSSAFAGKIGQRVAAKGVTVVDDGTLKGRRGSLNIDDEGHTTQRNVLIEDGILQGYMQDAMNARLMNASRTGNARRESYAHLPMPRMTNTYMLGGSHEPQEIIASVKYGIYAPNFGGGQVDITNGKFVFSTTEAYLIENGKITAPIKGATLIGNGPDALTKIKMMGNDMSLDSGVGVCGKEGQSVPVGVGQPTLRIDGLTVGGAQL
ncbi:metalloprotease TldD [Hydromonas duriensis]|uniref:Microcin-processing peptidase 2 n=1 Tax=Hydromonas duriensis TaxID=1527608 RepID=A0A4R6Y6T9_9BURK|nr:metalloprotease TldD [Hydromonas duriensis]TDR31078.1 microcin-processing peptidase 2 [Hydromonas duriensis]